jgi:diguanylate cyclase (GGDEF)-like protein
MPAAMTYSALEPLPTTQFLTSSPDASVVQVIQTMHQAQASCTVVLQDGAVVGLFTLADAARSLGLGAAQASLSLAEAMTPTVVTLSEPDASDVIQVMATFQRYGVRHIPVLSQEGAVVTVITPSQIQAQFQPIDRLRLLSVRDVMTPHVFYTTPEMPVYRVAQLMAAHCTDAIVIAEPLAKTIQPLGIITQGDLVQLQSLELDCLQTPSAEVMSTPLLPLHLQESLWTAHQRMQEHLVRRLVVVGDRDELIGMVRRWDVLQALDPAHLYTNLRALQQNLDACNLALQRESAHRRLLETQLQRTEQELQTAYENIDRLAHFDPLTQLANRRHFDQALSQEWQRLRREKAPLAIIVGDIDRFQAFNQHYGAVAGDACLKRLAGTISTAMRRSTDLAARYGAEEFALLLPYTDAQGALRLTERIQSAVAALQIPHDRSPIHHHVTLSYGIASCTPSSATSFLELVSAADRALYRAQREGGHTVRVAVENDIASKPKFRVLDWAQLPS